MSKPFLLAILTPPVATFSLLLVSIFHRSEEELQTRNTFKSSCESSHKEYISSFLSKNAYYKILYIFLWRHKLSSAVLVLLLE